MAEKKTTKKTTKKKKSEVKRLIIILITIIVLGLAVIVGFGFNYLFGGLNQNDIGNDFSELGIDSSRYDLTKGSNIVNIALFGVDNRGNAFTGLSDTIIIASLNRNTGAIKLISIARDDQVHVEGYGEIKANAAYSYGGPVLAIKTLNSNFDLDIQDYATINIANLAKVIDAAGGVTIEITEAEKNMANGIMDELTPKAPKIQKSGTVLLDGTQATAYCRIRKLDSDIYRISRQKKVLEVLFQKAKTLDPIKMAETVHEIMPMVETSLNYNEIISLASILTNSKVHLENLTFPHKNTEYTNNSAWDIVFDLDVAAQEIHDYIYNDINPEDDE